MDGIAVDVGVRLRGACAPNDRRSPFLWQKLWG